MSERLKKLMLNENLDIKIIKALKDLIAEIESNDTFIEHADTPATYTGEGGKAVFVKGAEDGLEFNTIITSDEKVSVSATDTTGSYLDDELVLGSNKLSKNILNPGADETLELDVDQTNIDHDLLLNYIAGEHLNPSQTIIVAKSGGDYTSIQDAINSITDASAIKPYVILIYPGIYAEDITMKAWVSLVGVGAFTDAVISGVNSAPLITFPAGFDISTIRNLTIKLNPTSNSQSCVLVQNGIHVFDMVEINMSSSTNDIVGTLISCTGGLVNSMNVRHVYDLAGTHANVKTHNIINISGTGYYTMQNASFTFDITDDNDIINVINDSSTTTSECFILRSHALINLLSGTYSGTFKFMNFTGSGDRSISTSNFAIECSGNGTGTFHYIDSASGSLTINSNSNNINLTGFTTNYFADIASGDILNTFFDDIVAADGHNGDGTYNYANSPSPNVFAAHQIQLDNNGGNAIEFPTGQNAEEAKSYRFDMGGGSLLPTDQDCTVEFGMDACVNNTENKFIIDVGNVYWASAVASNDFIIRSYNGIDDYQFLSAFGGFNNPEYGWALQRLPVLGELTGKTLFFDNQTPISDFRRSVDFRIDGVNYLTIENGGEVVVSSRLTTPRADITAIQNGSGVGTGGVAAITMTGYANFFGINWFDFMEWKGTTANLPTAFGILPNGTSENSYLSAYNSSNIGAGAWIQVGMRSSIAEIVVRDFSQPTDVTTLNIGSGGNDFPLFDVTCSTLTDINFIFAGLTECTIQPDTLVFNNGATDTQLDWSVNGQLGLQVAAADIIRIASTLTTITPKLLCSAEVEIDGDLNHDGNNVGFYGVAPTVRPAAYTQTYATTSRTHNNLTSATLTDSTGGSKDNTVSAITAVNGSGATTAQETDINNNFAEVTEEINALRVDIENIKQVLNQVIDDLQLNGLLQ